MYKDQKIGMETHPHSRNHEWLLHRDIMDGRKQLPRLPREENNEESQPVREENGATISACGWQECGNGGMDFFSSLPT